MTPPSGDGDKLAALLTRLLGKLEPAPVSPQRHHECMEPLVECLVYSFLLWESTPSAAAEAFGSLGEWIIDPNELRVALTDEIIEWTGARDAFGAERADRLRAALNSVFQREHRVSLDAVDKKSKREAREYLDSLDGMTPFVAARVTLFAFHGHAIPIDRRLFDLLVGEGVLDPALALDEAERWLERQIRASDAEQLVPLLEAWREASAARTPASRGGEKQGAKKSTRTPRTKRAKKDA